VRAGWRPGAPIIVSSSRAVLYAGAGEDFAAAAREVALATRAQLQQARQWT
jgi:orotidine-5'-phosphate decarboxylase